MKKLRFILIALGSLVVIYAILHMTGAFRSYTVRTAGNEPALPVGSHVFVTNLTSPQRLDFICFSTEDNQQNVQVKRLCGLPNETVEIRNGLFYADGINVDNTITLKRKYFGTGPEAESFIQKKSLPFEEVFRQPGNDTIFFFLEEKQVEQADNIYRYYVNQPDSVLTRYWETPYSIDNFGPVKIPDQCYFVLGDNRNNSWDSRHFGFVHKDLVTGIVFY